jgi:predicted RNase H-like HicB family nuclease
MKEATKFDILVMSENSQFSAICLQLNVAAQGKDFGQLFARLRESIDTFIGACRENGIDPMQEQHKAPKPFWDMYQASPPMNLQAFASVPEDATTKFLPQMYLNPKADLCVA